MKRSFSTMVKEVKKKKRPMSKKERLLFLLLIIVIAAGIIWYGYVTGQPDEEDYMAYPRFVSKVKDGKVVAAKVDDRYVKFTMKSGAELYTDNPDYDKFKQFLLVNGVRVEEPGKTLAATIADVTDIIFNLLFFAFIGFLLYQFLGLTGKNTFKVVKYTDVTFEDVCGMDDVKEEMMSAVEILKYPDRFAAMGIRPIKGIILEGPPGNGKTLFAKALATECHVNFIAAKGADFQSAIMSMGAAKTKSLFMKAKRQRPCIIFIDEFDSIGERRNYAGTGIDKENNRIITTMLNMMDGFEDNEGVLVIAATNSYHSLDRALVRPGRFDLKYHIGNPDDDTIRELIEYYTIGKAIDSQVDMDDLVASFAGLSCAAIETIINEAATMAAKNRTKLITAEYLEEAKRRTSYTKE